MNSWRENNTLREKILSPSDLRKAAKRAKREDKYYNRLIKIADLLDECIRGDYIPEDKKEDFRNFLKIMEDMLSEGFEPVKNPFFPNGYQGEE